MSREEASDRADAGRPDLARLARHLRLRLEADGRAGLTAVPHPAQTSPTREALAPDEESRDPFDSAAPRSGQALPAAAREGPAAEAAGSEGPARATGDAEGRGPDAARDARAAEAVAGLKEEFAEAAADVEAAAGEDGRPLPRPAQSAAEAEAAASTPAVGVKGPGLFDALSPDLEDGSSPEEALRRVADEVASCRRCPDLAAGRTLTVPGQGSPRADLMFVGEGPGAEEDKQGLAFVGRAGGLLTKMIEAIGMTRDEVFIANIVKCRPPDNRKPAPEEEANCVPYLARQIEIIRPKVIVALGGTAAQYLLQTRDGITRLRGRFYPYMGSRLMPTFHPAYLLRNYTKDTRRKVYDDLLAAKAALSEA